MLTLPSSVRIYLAVDPVDMRAGHDGLAGIVSTQWGLDLYEGHLFVFVGKRRDRVKILVWERGGFVLYYKRLERGRFRLPKVNPKARTVQMDAVELGMLLDGIDVSGVKRPPKWEPRRKVA